MLGPFTDLERDLVLADTPGAGSIHEHHDQILHAFIPRSDAVIFLVTAAMPLDQDELELLRKVQAADIKKVFFVINKVDAADAPEIDEAIRHNQQCLQEIGVEVATIHRLSAKRAFEGEAAGSGLKELQREITEFLATNKGRVLQARLLSRVQMAAQPVIQLLAVRLASVRKTDAEIDNDLQNLKTAKEQILRERPVSEKQFRNQWNLAIGTFARALKQAEQEVASHLDATIENAPLASLEGLQKDLPTLMLNQVRISLEPHTQELEQTLLAAANAFETSYPAIQILSDTAAVSIRINADSTLLVGGFTGAATAATGVALAWAAGSAVASVAAPTLLGSLGATGATMLGFSGLSPVISALGTASVPTWLALLGPVGWTIAGIGLLVVPLGWRLSKLKMKDQLARACRDHLASIFRMVGTEGIEKLRQMAEAILKENRERLDHELASVEGEITRVRKQRPSAGESCTLENQVLVLNDALSELAQMGA